MSRAGLVRLRAFAGVLILVAMATPPHFADGFDDITTHVQLTAVSTLRSSVDRVLKTELGLRAGSAADLRSGGGRSQTVAEWLQIGSRLEDEPPCRAGNHFHNPLRPFTTSQVSDRPDFINFWCGFTEFTPIRSNVMWSTRFVSPTEQGPAIGNPFDWVAAHQAYLDALTASLSGAREAALARTFETLGHVMHLVQDLAVPAHVRNDFASHLEYCVPRLASFSRWCENGFERFVKLRPDLVDNAASRSVEFAGQPVTRFWDLDRYTGFNPSSDTAQGLAE